MKSYNFSQMSVVGKWAVDRLTEYFKDNNWNVVNVEDDPFFQALDIDLVIMPVKLTTHRYIEVKADRYKSGNIYVETIGNHKTGAPGCLIYTGADFIAYYLVREGFCLMIPVPELKAWIPDNINRFPQKTVRSTFDSGTSFTSGGHPVPIDVIVSEVTGTFKIYDLPRMAN